MKLVIIELIEMRVEVMLVMEVIATILEGMMVILEINMLVEEGLETVREVECRIGIPLPLHV